MDHAASGLLVSRALHQQDVPPRSVVIVGGGFSGAVLAYHLLQRPSPLKISIVERGPHLGRGIAYAAQSEVLRLNVPAARMSLDPARADDFVRFAGRETEPHAFLPRRQFGAYVEARLADAARTQPDRLSVVRGDAVAVEHGYVRLADGRRIAGDRIVIATGLAANSGTCQWPTDERVIEGWDEAGCTRAAKGGRVLLVGSGLSAVDVMALLAEAGHRDEVVVLSRHGMLPRPHAARSGSVHLPTSHTSAPRQLRALMSWIRSLVLEAQRNGAPWQHAIDALRPQLPQLWQRLSARDRARFVHRVRPYWDVLRHRAPRDVLANIEQQRTQGRVRVLSGRVLESNACEQGIEVSLRLRGGECRIERFSHVVRCVGPVLSVDASASPLLAAMMRSGLAKPDANGLGIVTLEHGRLSDAAGQPSKQLFALGAPCRASRWETTSVPEIVADAVALAQLLSAEASPRVSFTS